MANQAEAPSPVPAVPHIERAVLHVQQLGCVAYPEALALQEALLAARIEGVGEDQLLLLEHPPVYTLGRGADAADLRGAPGRLGVPVYRVGRGGGATFHGPGQLVAYPIVRLRAAGRDVHRYVRVLEAALIATCARFGVTAVAPAGQTGIWVGARKIGAIGIGVRRGVAYHGVALNVSTDLSFFAHIVPCRTSGMAVTSFAEVLGSAPPVTEVATAFAESFADAMRDLPVDGPALPDNTLAGPTGAGDATTVGARLGASVAAPRAADALSTQSLRGGAVNDQARRGRAYGPPEGGPYTDTDRMVGQSHLVPEKARGTGRE